MRNRYTIFLLLAFALFFTGAFSQITYNRWSLPEVGCTFAYDVDTVAPQTLIGPSGGPHTWDFSNLNVNSQDTFAMLDPGATQFASDFPTADIATHLAGEDFYFFSHVDTTGPTGGVEIFGAAADFFGQGSYDIVSYPDPYRVISVPFTYNDSYTDTSFSQFTVLFNQFGFDTARLEQRIYHEFSSDAWGTMFTPNDTVEVIRVLHVEERFDTSWARNTATGNWVAIDTDYGLENSFTWYSDQKRFFVAEASVDSGGTSFLSVLVDDGNCGVISSRENWLAPEAVQIYPQPAKDQLNVSLQSGHLAEIRFLDLMGREVLAEELSGNFARIDVSLLKKGIYVYELRSQSGKMRTGRVLIE